MLERLYDLDSGEIRVENNNIQALSVPWLRSRLGLVSQVSLQSPASSSVAEERFLGTTSV